MRLKFSSTEVGKQIHQDAMIQHHNIVNKAFASTGKKEWTQTYGIKLKTKIWQVCGTDTTGYIFYDGKNRKFNGSN